jgi:hypothetical protein
MVTYNIQLPTGEKAQHEFTQQQAEYWISMGLCAAHGFMIINKLFSETDIVAPNLSTMPVGGNS